MIGGAAHVVGGGFHEVADDFSAIAHVQRRLRIREAPWPRGSEPHRIDHPRLWGAMDCQEHLQHGWMGAPEPPELPPNL